MSRLSKAIDRAIERSRRRTTIQGSMGKRLSDGSYLFVVEDRPECVWVTLRIAVQGQTTVPAINTAGVKHAPRLAVDLFFDGDDYIILRKSPKSTLSKPSPSDPSGNEPHLHSHASLSDLDRDHHPQYHNDSRGDARYFTKAEHVDSTSGAPDEGKPLVLDSNGLLNNLVGSTVNGAAAKTTPVDADTFPIIDTEDSNILKKISWANIKATLKSYFDTLYVSLTGAQTVNGKKTFPDGILVRGSPPIEIESGASDFALFYFTNTEPTGNRYYVYSSLTGYLQIGKSAGGPSQAISMEPVDGNWGVGIIPAAAIAKLHVLQQSLGVSVLRLQSTSTGDDPIQDTIQGRTATTNATPTSFQTILIPTNYTGHIEAVVTAIRTGGSSGAAGDCAAYVLRGLYKNVAGTVTLVGAVVQTVVGESQAGWDATLTIVGTGVRIQVTGAANNNVTWHATSRFWFLSG